MTAPPRIDDAAAAAAAAIDWDKLGFDIVRTRSYAEYTWRDGAWDAGVLVPSGPLSLDVWATSLHYGQACFEGLKAFRMRDGKVRVFRPDVNARRLQLSCRAISMPEVSVELFVEAVNRAVTDNLDFVPPYGHSGSLYIRPFVVGSGPQVGLTPAPEFKFIVVVNPVGDYYRGGISQPVRAVIQHGFDRAAPRGTGHTKVAGNYAPCLGPTTRAKKHGYTVMLFLDPKTNRYIDEFATSNFAALTRPDVNGRRTYVTPRSRSILSSVTNRSLTELAVKHFGWTAERRQVSWDEVRSGAFDEVVACGTAVVVTPIGAIDREVLLDTAGASADPRVAPLSSATTGIEHLWDDAELDNYTDDDDAAPRAVQSVEFSSNFEGFKQLQKAYRQIQTGDLDGWESYGWMLPAAGL
ncbi:hypothetical protein HK105_208480 [Polyrhizophydium stewartii]|uniref:Branched-chain-amino-acid aminotransferase n=1 Tax=Polyrhizophydium stewartii TaxID=2732419 RepID=A0ABR4MXR2_9FUNG|nr:hypothetical protein HK105_006046 [Polyrhizophydium stewartii]